MPIVHNNDLPAYVLDTSGIPADKDLLKYKVMFENASDIIFFYLIDGTIIDVNEAAVQAYGYSHDELLSMNIVDLRIESEKPKIKKQTEECCENPCMFETIHQRKDGSTFPVEITARCLFVGKTGLLAAIVRDITMRKAAEGGLRSSEEKFRVLAQSAEVAIFLYQKGHIIYANPAAESMTGYGTDELYRMSVADLMRSDFIKKEKEITYARLNLQPVPREYEAVIVTRSGSERWVTITGGYMELDGEPTGIISALDITVRKKAEEAVKKSRAILARAQFISHVGNWARNLRTNVIQCSDEMYRIFGYKPQEFTMTYEWLLSRIHPDDREHVVKSKEEMIAGNKLYRIDFRIIRPDGTERYVSDMVDRIKNGPDGRPEWMYGIIQDITDRKLIENKLRDAQLQSELYVDLMGHDINNMNMVALGFLEMADNKLDTEGVLDRNDEMLIKKPMENLEKSSLLIDNVRKLQREKAGEFKIKAMEVGEVLSSVKEQYQCCIGRNIEINLNMACRCTVMANDLLRDVFSNLVGNAIKHSSGPLTINIGMTCPVEGKTPYCKVIIEDNGPGIPDAMKAAIFDRLGTRKKGHGRGLGLYIVSTLVSDFHGKVLVEDSVPGDYSKGARFIVILPAVLAQ